MSESKINATERLRREGRWDEASQYRDQVRQRLKAGGTPRAQAGEAAWAAMLERYPPLPPKEHPPIEDALPDEDVSLEALLERCDGIESDLVRDVLWTYENIENRKARPGDAPTAGAWSLLKWARGCRNRFFEQVLPKAMAARVKREETPGDADDPGIEGVQRMLAKLTESWEAALIANASDTIQQDVRRYLEDWQRQWQVVMSLDAARSLQYQLVRLVDRCVRCALMHPQEFRRLQ